MAQYRYEQLDSRSIEWTGKTGSHLSITVRLTQEMIDYFGNEEWRPTRNGLSICYAASVDGRRVNGFVQINPVSGHPGIVAAIGNIGLSAERLADIRAAEAAIERHPAWQAKLAAESASAKIEADYHAHVAAVDRMMTLGGRSE